MRSRQLVVVQFEQKGSYQGMPSGVPHEFTNDLGFSRCRL